MPFIFKSGQSIDSDVVDTARMISDGQPLFEEALFKKYGSLVVLLARQHGVPAWVVLAAMRFGWKPEWAPPFIDVGYMDSEEIASPLNSIFYREVARLSTKYTIDKERVFDAIMYASLDRDDLSGIAADVAFVLRVAAEYRRKLSCDKAKNIDGYSDEYSVRLVVKYLSLNLELRGWRREILINFLMEGEVPRNLPKPGESFNDWKFRIRSERTMDEYNFTSHALRQLGKVSWLPRHVVSKASIEYVIGNGRRKVRNSDIQWGAWAEFQKLSKAEQAAQLSVGRAWIVMTGRLPKFLTKVRNKGMFRPELINWKQFVKAMRLWAPDEEDWASMSEPIYSLIRVFGSINEVRRLLPKDSSRPESVLVHDLGQFAFSGTATYWKGFFMRHPEALKNAHHAETWESNASRPPKSAVEFDTFAAKQLYIGATNEAVAEQAAKFKLSNNSFRAYQDVYEHKKLAEACPQVQVSSGSYRFYKLEADDVRGAFLGLYTNCCQHLDSAGSSCARAGAINSTSSFYVVDYKGEIIAQSWAWRGTKGELVFDSIEGLRGYDYNVVANLYQKAAKLMLGRLQISRVLVGDTSFGITSNVKDFLEGKKVKKPAEMVESVSYTDARRQWLLAEGSKTGKFSKKEWLPHAPSESWKKAAKANRPSIARNELMEGSDVFCEHCDAEVHPDCEICPSCGRDISEWVD